MVPKDGNKHIKILNTTEKEVEVKETEIVVEPMKKETNIRMFEKFKNLIKIENLDSAAKSDILKICKDYANIFQWGEPL
jgi:hypothetical protein